MIDEQEEALRLPKFERADFLATHAISVENGEYFKKFDDDDVEQANSEFMANNIDLETKTAEFNDIKQTFKAEEKTIKKAQKKLTKAVMQNGEFRDGNLYCFPDYTRGVMNLLDQFGGFVRARPLKDEEKQLNMFKKIGNG